MEATIEQGTAARFEMQPSLLQRCEVRDDLRLGARAAHQQPPQLGLQVAIRDVTQFPECPAIHETMLPRCFSSSVTTRHRFFKGAITSKDIALAEALHGVTSRDHDAMKSHSRLELAGPCPIVSTDFLIF